MGESLIVLMVIIRGVLAARAFAVDSLSLVAAGAQRKRRLVLVEGRRGVYSPEGSGATAFERFGGDPMHPEQIGFALAR